MLSGLVKRIDRSVKAISVNDVASLEKVEEAIATDVSATFAPAHSARG